MSQPTQPLSRCAAITRMAAADVQRLLKQRLDAIAKFTVTEMEIAQ